MPWSLNLSNSTWEIEIKFLHSSWVSRFIYPTHYSKIYFEPQQFCETLYRTDRYRLN